MTQTATHTPGPWTARQDCRSYRNRGVFSGGNPDQSGNQNAWAIYGHARIATLTESEAWLPQTQIEANARLIAAAPDLLAALVATADALDSTRPYLAARDAVAFDAIHKEVRQAVDSARAAIAKATGE